MKDSMGFRKEFWTILIACFFVGCGTSEGERLQFVGTWSFDLSDSFLPPAALSGTDEALTILAKMLLSTSTLEMNSNGAAILTIGGSLSEGEIPKWRIRTGTWKVNGSGTGLSLQLNFPDATELADQKESTPSDAETNRIKQLLLSCVPNGEGPSVQIVFDEPNEFGVVNKFTRLLPSSTSSSSRIK